MAKQNAAATNSKLLAYFRLFRLPNVFTAVADVTMGFLFVQTKLQPWPIYAGLALASVLLYIAGMVLNDVYDVEQDQRERPERPIPAGDIPLVTARRLGYLLLLAGVLCGWVAPHLETLDGVSRMRSGCIATLLAVCVVAYDAVLKKTPLAPLLMGGCRFLNVLLGMSVGRAIAGPAYLCGFAPTSWWPRRESGCMSPALPGSPEPKPPQANARNWPWGPWSPPGAWDCWRGCIACSLRMCPPWTRSIGLS